MHRFFTFIILGLLALMSVAFAQLPLSVEKSGQLPSPDYQKSTYEKLESVLSEFLDVYPKKGSTEAAKFAVNNNIETIENRILIELWMRPNRHPAELDPSLMDEFGIEVKSQSEHFILLYVPIDKLAEFAVSSDIFSLVMRPVRPVPFATSEGVELIGALDYHASGLRGAGVKIAVIDQSFRSLRELQERGELPRDCFTRDFTGGEMEGTSRHGSSCTEVVYDFAPEADYYLLRAPSTADFENAFDFMIEEEIDVVSCSYGWFVLPSMTSYHQSDDIACEKVNEAWAAGIFPACAAGNSAVGHLRSDIDIGENGWHFFDENIDKNRIGYNGNDLIFFRNGWIKVCLIWDDFPESDQDYDLFLFRWDDDNNRWIQVASSVNRQDGDDPPIEILEHIVQVEGTFAIGIFNRDADAETNFSLWVKPEQIEYHTSDYSMTIPATAEGAFAVGAVDHEDWNDEDLQQMVYSSQGPTYDNDRVKPDIVAPTNVRTTFYRHAGGTSLAAPHVAGAAALVLSANPDFSNENVKDFLFEFAVDAGEEGPDNIFGFGLLNLFGSGSVVEGYIFNAETDSVIGGSVITTSIGTTDTTDMDGFYRFDQFGGVFDLTVSSANFIDSTITDIAHEVGDTLELSIGLLHAEFNASVENLQVDIETGRSGELDFSIENTGNGSLIWSVDPRPTRDWEFPDWDYRDSYDLGEILDDSRIEGLVFIEDKFYVAGQGNNSGYIYILDINGRLIETLDQPGNGNFRDLAWDGELIWGSSEEFLFGITTEGEVVDNLIGPELLHQALAFDQGRNLLWVSGIESDISGINREGDVIQTLDGNGLRIYGLAFWEDDPDRCQLYLFCNPEGEVNQLVYKMNIETGDTMFVANLGTIVEGSAKGTFISDQFDIYNLTYMSIVNNGANDRIDVWQLETNIFWMSVDPEEGILNPETIQELALSLDANEFVAENLLEGRLLFTHNGVGSETEIPVSMRVTLNIDNQQVINPTEFEFLPAYPNPFNGITNLDFSLPFKSVISLNVYDITGRLVSQVVNEQLFAGNYHISWDASEIPSGLYLAHLKTCDTEVIQKIMLIR